MADDRERRSKDPGADQSEETASDADSTGAVAPADPIAELEAELRAKADEAAKNFELYLRERAESENFKKRVLRDKTEAVRFGNEALVRELLPLLDNLELAIGHAELGGNGKSVVEGVEMIIRMFREVLERNGVTPIDVAQGAAFDPSIHEAAGVESSTEVEPNAVIRQDQKGYQMHGRLLRPARVVVSAATQENEGNPEG